MNNITSEQWVILGLILWNSVLTIGLLYLWNNLEKFIESMLKFIELSRKSNLVINDALKATDDFIVKVTRMIAGVDDGKSH